MLLCCCGEFLFRVYAVIRHKNQTVWNSYRYLYRQDPQLPYAYKSNLDVLVGGKYSIQTNSLGWRSEEVSLQKTENSLRVLFVGGSNVFSVFATSNSKTFPAQVQAQLNGKLTNGRVECFNCGVPGFTSRESLSIVTSMMLKYEIDVVVVMNSVNDVIDDMYWGLWGRPFPGPYACTWMERFPLYRYSVMFQWVSRRVRMSAPSKPGRNAEEVSAVLRQLDPSVSLGRISEIVDFAKKHDVDVLILSEPFSRVSTAGFPFPNLNPEELYEKVDEYNDACMGMSGENVKVLDVSAELQKTKVTFQDWTHVDDAGIAIESGLVAEALLGSGWLHFAGK